MITPIKKLAAAATPQIAATGNTQIHTRCSKLCLKDTVTIAVAA
jgi:hypothetical protein